MDKVFEHEDHQPRLALRDFIASMWASRGIGIPPAFELAQGILDAEVNHNRWVVDCPEPNCGGALIVTSRESYFLCPECGSPGNGGNWYNVRFPPEKRAIEEALKKRPLHDPRYRGTRNWRPMETVAALRLENRTHGLEV